MKSEQDGSTGRRSPTKPEPKSSPAPLDRAGKRFWFRLVALFLPFLLVLLLEAGLRLAGYGYPTCFFLEAHQNGRKILIENPKFGWRFFPPAVARAPLPLVIEPQKPPGSLRIFLFGESAAMGDPDPAYGFGRQLDRILQARYSGEHTEVINVAMTAINSHVIREIAHDCARRQGDIWLIYAGNNEVVGPFGAGTVFGPRAPGLSAVRAGLALKSSRFGQWLTALRSNREEPKQWAGMELFLNNQVRSADRALKQVYRNFSANLTDIIRAGRRAGATIILATVAVNLKDCPPFASAHRGGVTAAELQNWERLFAQGRKLESGQHYDEALTLYRQAAQIDPEFAELIFRRATCELAVGQTQAAKADFVLARDLDTLRFRADSVINSLIRQVALAEQVPLVDAEEQCALQSPEGLPGDAQFYDHVHFNFTGNYRIATLLAAQIEKELVHPNKSVAPLLSESEVAHQLAYTEFDRRRIAQEMRLRLQQPPFSRQSNFKERDQRWQQSLAAPEPPAADAVWEYRAALALAPADWVLRENFGHLLEATPDKAGAAEQWNQVIQRLPWEPEGYFHLGNLAFDGQAYSLAAARFRQALKRRPNSTEALNGLGLAFAAQGRTNEALGEFSAALKLNPAFSAARVNIAVLLANCGDPSGAASEYRNVLRIDTNNIAARINLAKLLSGEGQKDEAIALYTQALVLKPDNPVAQFDLGNALSAGGQHEEALKHYAAAVEYQPDFADAQYNLALELARSGRIGEAVVHFSETVRLRPSSADAHFNLGVALAKLQRYDEAAEQFQETLRFEPNHPSAQAMLDRARRLSSK